MRARLRQWWWAKRPALAELRDRAWERAKKIGRACWEPNPRSAFVLALTIFAAMLIRGSNDESTLLHWIGGMVYGGGFVWYFTFRFYVLPELYGRRKGDA
ncbi:hypothetical protein GS982_20055 [Rhodococcus hoagii]|nr:hypothetical protein [Prescottella equi]